MIIELYRIGPRFIEMAHGIGMAVVATVDAQQRPHTRVMQPVWTWEGPSLIGWVSTVSTAPKVAEVLGNAHLSLTYWDRNQDTCTADCVVERVVSDRERAAAWQRFIDAPAPAGFDPAIHPDWDDHRSPAFGVWRLQPTWLRVVPGTLMTEGRGEVWTWRQSATDAALDCATVGEAR